MPRAGLTPASVTAAGAALADEVGIDRLSMGLLAERLGVRTPSLYKHVAGQADLVHRIAVLAMTEVADALRDATQGRAGRDALVAGTPRATPPARPGLRTRSPRPSTGCSPPGPPCCADTDWTPTGRSRPCGCCAASCTLDDRLRRPRSAGRHRHPGPAPALARRLTSSMTRPGGVPSCGPASRWCRYPSCRGESAAV